MAMEVQPSERLACNHSTAEKLPFAAALSIAFEVQPSGRLVFNHSKIETCPSFVVSSIVFSHPDAVDPSRNTAQQVVHPRIT